jgi:hypothetical protein
MSHHQTGQNTDAALPANPLLEGGAPPPPGWVGWRNQNATSVASISTHPDRPGADSAAPSSENCRANPSCAEHTAAGGHGDRTVHPAAHVQGGNAGS